MKKIILWIVWILAFVILAIAAAGFYKFNILGDDIYVQTASGGVVKYNDIIHVSGSIIPFSSVINTIGWEYVEVNNIIPAGVSPHGFDMSARDVVALKDSEVVFMTWLEHIDGFLEKAADKDKQIHLADGMEFLEASGHDHDEHEDEENHDEHENEDEHKNDIHTIDPHVWLGKDNIFTIADTIEAKLSEILPEQADYFAENTQDFKIEVESIYTEFATNIDNKTAQEFIVFHDAYNYLFESIGLDGNLKIPFSENVLHESGTAHFAELIDEVELHNIKYIFSEPQFNNTSLQKFTQQYNLTLRTLDPIGNNDSANGYINNLSSNLSALRNIYE